MSLFDKKKKTRSAVWLTAADADDTLCVSGYTPLDRNPEIVAGCRQIAQLISSMTIYLMANTERGDVRIVNELSRTVDIFPCRTMTRRTWMDTIVMNLLLYGNGNSVIYTEVAHSNTEPAAYGKHSNDTADCKETNTVEVICPIVKIKVVCLVISDVGVNILSGVTCKLTAYT